MPTLVLAIMPDILLGPHAVGWSRTNHVTNVFAAIAMLFPAKVALFSQMKSVRYMYTAKQSGQIKSRNPI